MQKSDVDNKTVPQYPTASSIHQSILRWIYWCCAAALMPAQLLSLPLHVSRLMKSDRSCSLDQPLASLGFGSEGVHVDPEARSFRLPNGEAGEDWPDCSPGGVIIMHLMETMLVECTAERKASLSKVLKQQRRSLWCSLAYRL